MTFESLRVRRIMHDFLCFIRSDIEKNENTIRESTDFMVGRRTEFHNANIEKFLILHRELANYSRNVLNMKITGSPCTSDFYVEHFRFQQKNSRLNLVWVLHEICGTYEKRNR